VYVASTGPVTVDTISARSLSRRRRPLSSSIAAVIDAPPFASGERAEDPGREHGRRGGHARPHAPEMLRRDDGVGREPVDLRVVQQQEERAEAADAVVAALGLRGQGLPRVAARPAGVLKAFHSGVLADYVVWLTVGTAVLGGIWAITLR
jgi:hypothetical protein